MLSVRSCFASCRCCADSRDYHERIRYHADRFAGKGGTEQILRRYEIRRPSASILELQKCTFHIASWVVKLESHRMTSKHGDLSAMSAVLLLVQYLDALNARKDAKPLCNQLLTLLKTVLEHSLNSWADSEQWRLLSDHISLLLAEPQVPQPDPGSDVFQQMDEENSKAARLLQKAVQIWRNTSEMDQAAYVTSLEEALEALHAVDGTDLKKVRSIFRRAVAALSPPRLASGEGNSDGMQQTESTSTDFQHRLRQVVLWCLDYLDLTDPKIKPSLQMLECLLQKFQELSTGTVGGRRQWIRLQAKSNSVSGEGAVASAQDHAIKQAFERKRKLCEHNLRKDRCRTCQPCPHGNARFHCIHCSGCSHGHFKRNCAACNGCPHGKYTVSRCAICNPCPHGKVRRSCQQCSSCAHGKLRSNCRVCNACPHGHLKSYCKECKGKSHWIHQAWSWLFICQMIDGWCIADFGASAGHLLGDISLENVELHVALIFEPPSTWTSIASINDHSVAIWSCTTYEAIC